MERFLLFIRDDGREDVADLYPNEPAARTALVEYIRQRNKEAARPQPRNDADAISAYFGRATALYAIARVAPVTR